MEFFNKAKAIRLRSHNSKYMVADEDEETVRQSHFGNTAKARWEVELVKGHHHVIRLKSCYGKYLTAREEPFLLGMTGKKVMQTYSSKDKAMDWEPIKDGLYVKLRAKGGKFLRANNGPPPWRNSITHGVVNRTVSQDWILWEVEVVDMEIESVNDSLCQAPSFSSFAGSDCSDSGSQMAACRSSSCGPYMTNEYIKEV